MDKTSYIMAIEVIQRKGAALALVTGFQVSMAAAAMAMGFAHLNADQVKLPMPDSPFGDDLLGELADLVNGPFEHDRLNALVVIKVGVHG